MPKIETGTARRVAGRIDHILIIRRDIDVFPNLQFVIGFEGLLQTVTERSVSSQDADTARGEVILLDARNAVNDPRQSHRIVGAVPESALDAQPRRAGLGHVGVGPVFGLAVVPAQAGEDADAVDQFVFGVESEAVFEAVPGGCQRYWPGASGCPPPPRNCPCPRGSGKQKPTHRAQDHDYGWQSGVPIP